MNQRQSDEAEGFAELLAISGIELTHNGNEFTALVADAELEPEAYDRTPSDDNAVTVKTWLSAFPGGLPREGAYFEGGAGTRFRVTDVNRKPAKLTVIFLCTVTYD